MNIIDLCRKYLHLKTLLFVFFTAIGTIGLGQCFQIESILVDACGTPEGPNEMLRFKVGNAPLLVSDMQVTWPNNPFLGFCQNANTANKVQQLNQTIVTCGHFLEPTNGVLPANATVLIITSEDFDPTAHNYAGLQDTMYVLFQCIGNTSGHFANWVNNCDPATGDRTTTISFGTGCTQTVTYNRCFLTNQFGGIGGSPADRDGARADFDVNGNVTYPNDGCVVPYIPIEVAIANLPNNGAVCFGDNINVSGTISGNGNSVQWSSNFGTFSNPNSNSSSYSPNDTTNHFIYFSGLNACGDLTIDSVAVIVNPNQPEYTVFFNDSTTLCDLSQGTITIQTNDNITWANGSSNTSFTPTQPGWQHFTVSNFCNTIADSVFIAIQAAVSCDILPHSNVLCEDESLTIVAGVNNANLFGWSGNMNNQTDITITQPGTYQFLASNNCGSCLQNVTIENSNFEASFVGNPEQGNAPLTVQITNNTNNAVSEEWFLNGVPIDLQNDTLIFSENGEYLLTLLAIGEDGCSSEWSQLFTVQNNLSVYIPNVITPNGDGINDFFTITINQLGTLNFEILNRWGNIMQSGQIDVQPDEPVVLWGGMSNNTTANDGVYFYKINFQSALSGTAEHWHGFFHVHR